MRVEFYKYVLPVLLSLLFISIVVAAMLHSGEYSDRAVAWLYDKFIASPPPTSTGLAVSVVATLIGLVYVLSTQNRPRPDFVRRYRKAELILMKKRVEFRRDMVSYHTNFHWYSYACLGFQSVFLIVVFLAPEKFRAMPQVSQVAVFLGLALLGISTIILSFTDFFHTNTLSPLVTSKKRMDLIQVIIMLGFFSYLLQLCSLGIFLALINPWLSLFTSITGVALMVLITKMRGVPVEELKQEFTLSLDELKVMSEA